MPKGKIGLSVLQRQWMQLSLGEDVEVTIFDPKSDGSNYIVSGITLEIDLFSRTRKVDEPIDSTELMTIFLKVFFFLSFLFFFVKNLSLNSS